MKFGRLYQVFDEGLKLTDILARVSDQNNKARKFLNNHIRKLKDSGEGVKALELEAKINELINAHVSVNFVAGYIVGSVIDVTDPGAKEEVKFLKKQLNAMYGFWPKEKAPAQPRKEDAEA